MRKDDIIRLKHMLDAAKEARSLLDAGASPDAFPRWSVGTIRKRSPDIKSLGFMTFMEG